MVDSSAWEGADVEKRWRCKEQGWEIGAGESEKVLIGWDSGREKVRVGRFTRGKRYEG